MSSCMLFSILGALGLPTTVVSSTLFSTPTVRGTTISTVRLPTDPIGTTTVTFSGVNAGSEIRVYLPDGTELAGVESCTANQVLTWNVYSPGVNSVVTIRIVNVAYKIKEFDYTPTVGAQTLPVQQEADKWYKNPL